MLGKGVHLIDTLSHSSVLYLDHLSFNNIPLVGVRTALRAFLLIILFISLKSPEKMRRDKYSFHMIYIYAQNILFAISVRASFIRL